MNNQIRINKNKLIATTIIIITTIMVFSLTTATATAAAQENFEVEIIDNNLPVEEGQNLEVKAKIHNTGDNDNTQNIKLFDFDDNCVDNNDVFLENGDEKNVTLTWETQEGDAGTDNITVQSENDNDSIKVTINPNPVVFEVKIIDNNAPVVEGENLEVTVEIRNTGDDNDNQNIKLLNSDPNEVLDNRPVPLDNDETKTDNLKWETEVGEAGTYNLKVTSENDDCYDTCSVEVKYLVYFEVDSIEPDLGVVEGEELNVKATIRNTGVNTDTQNIELFDPSGDVVDTREDLTLGPDDDNEVELSWNTEEGDAGTREIKVSSADHEDVKEVTLQEKYYSITFEVEDNDGNALENATVEIGDNTQYTDADGQVVFDLIVDNHSYDVSKDGFLSESGEIEVTGNDTKTVTLEEEPEPDEFELSAFEVSSENLEPGENVTISAVITNIGEETGEREIDLIVENEVESNKSVELDGGENTNVEFVISKDNVGEYEVLIDAQDDSDSGTFKVFPIYNLSLDVVGEGTIDPEPDNYVYKENEDVTVEADPAENYKFVEWEGDYPENEMGEEQISITMDENKELTAHFEKAEEFSLTIDVVKEDPPHVVKILVNGQEITELPHDNVFPENYQFEPGESVDVELKAPPGRFTEWEGDCSENESEEEVIALSMCEEKEITAVFGELPSISENEVEKNGQPENIPNMSPDKPGFVKFENMGVENVRINVKEDIENQVRFGLKQLKGRPEWLPDPPGRVHKFFEFDVENFPRDENYEAEITAKVSIDWIEKENIDKNSIKMVRFDEEMHEWENLETEIIGEKDEYVYLFVKSKSDSFSIFSVTGDPKQSSLPWAWIGVVAVVIVVVVFLVFFTDLVEIVLDSLSSESSGSSDRGGGLPQGKGGGL